MFRPDALALIAELDPSAGLEYVTVSLQSRAS